LSEAIFQKPIDQFERYASIAREIEKLGENKLLVLDVGAGGKGVSSYEGLFAEKNCAFILFDIKKDLLIELEKDSVIGDGCRLPFKTKAFDVVVSVDTVEHIQKPLHHYLYTELRRD
jgi:2-polyprenyl-3-methyl-5-hydroxy-6-metoxy-1,4-benzoquinol methylase